MLLLAQSVSSPSSCFSKSTSASKTHTHCCFLMVTSSYTKKRYLSPSMLSEKQISAGKNHLPVWSQIFHNEKCRRLQKDHFELFPLDKRFLGSRSRLRVSVLRLARVLLIVGLYISSTNVSRMTRGSFL